MMLSIGGMPRTARASVGGMWYHVLNRRNRREPVFHKPGDYDAFVKAMTDACTRVRIDLLGYCLMPNHFHLIVRTDRDGDLGRWMQCEPLSAGDLKRLRHSVSRGRPYGSESWTRETATRLGLESCLRLRRRPRKDDGSKRYVPLFLCQ